MVDFRDHKRSEIDNINGAVAALGRQHNVPTPVNSFVTDLLRAAETKRLVPN